MDKEKLITTFKKPAKDWTNEEKGYIASLINKGRRAELKQLRESVNNGNRA